MIGIIKKGDYGRFKFFIKKRGFIQGFDLMATVVDVGLKLVYLTDNDGFDYLPQKKDITSFEREIFNPNIPICQ